MRQIKECEISINICLKLSNIKTFDEFENNLQFFCLINYDELNNFSLLKKFNVMFNFNKIS